MKPDNLFDVQPERFNVASEEYAIEFFDFITFPSISQFDLYGWRNCEIKLFGR